MLHPEVELHFDDPDLVGCTVADVLADPDRFEGETLADPLEGIEYGRCKAKIMRRSDGTPWINSFAHGRTIYALKLNADAVRKAMEEAAKEDVVSTLIELAVTADLNAVEMENLRQSAKKLSGAGLRAINELLKAAQQKQAKREKEIVVVQRKDPRPLIRVPPQDEPWLPQMDVLNEVISKTLTATPPLRNVDQFVADPRKPAIQEEDEQ